jgi:enterochelin esterase family protein
MEKYLSPIICFPVVLLFLASANVICTGEVKPYQVPEVEEASKRALTVYLPEGYSKSEAAYPVLYLLHEIDGDNLTFLGGGYPKSGGAMSDANVSIIAERLLKEGRIKPLIVACPDLGGISQYDIEYLLRRIVPFVDSTFRTIPNRESRAIAGHSSGGYLSLLLALSNPGYFSIVGGFSSYIAKVYFKTQLEELVQAHSEVSGSIIFWLYSGRQNQYGVTESNREFADFLNQNGLAAIYVEDDGDHTNQVADRLADFVEYISRHLER